ncbi:hypothetical protein ACFLVH_06550 [Chloroflexota bacterium]
METFRGKAHLPGADKEWNLELEIGWEDNEVSVHIDEAPGNISDWPGLAVQTFGPANEIVFRTKGIPRLFTHWWHFVHGSSNELWGIVLGLPDVEGKWRTCPVLLEKVK